MKMMKNILALVVILMSVTTSAQLDRSKPPKPATPKPIKMGDYESFELNNGLKVFVI